jgi:hypothetical protein
VMMATESVDLGMPLHSICPGTESGLFIVS